MPRKRNAKLLTKAEVLEHFELTTDHPSGIRPRHSFPDGPRLWERIGTRRTTYRLLLQGRHIEAVVAKRWLQEGGVA